MTTREAELSEKELEKLNTGRMLRAESDLLLPLLKTKETLAVARLISAFRAGDVTKLLPIAAELSSLADIKTTITQRIKEAEGLERKIHEQR